MRQHPSTLSATSVVADFQEQPRLSILRRPVARSLRLEAVAAGSHFGVFETYVCLSSNEKEVSYRHRGRAVLEVKRLQSCQDVGAQRVAVSSTDWLDVGVNDSSCNKQVNNTHGDGPDADNEKYRATCHVQNPSLRQREMDSELAKNFDCVSRRKNRGILGCFCAAPTKPLRIPILVVTESARANRQRAETKAKTEPLDTVLSSNENKVSDGG